MRLYLDTAPVIYVVEQVLPFFPVVDARLSASGMVLVANNSRSRGNRRKSDREEGKNRAPSRRGSAFSWVEDEGEDGKRSVASVWTRRQASDRTSQCAALHEAQATPRVRMVGEALGTGVGVFEIDL